MEFLIGFGVLMVASIALRLMSGGGIEADGEPLYPDDAGRAKLANDYRRRAEAQAAVYAEKQRRRGALRSFFDGVEVYVEPNIHGGEDLIYTKRGRATLEHSTFGSKHVIKEVRGRNQRTVYTGDASGAVDYVKRWKG